MTRNVYYVDIMCDKPNLIESAKYNAALATTGTWRGVSEEKLHQELGF